MYGLAWFIEVLGSTLFWRGWKVKKSDSVTGEDFFKSPYLLLVDFFGASLFLTMLNECGINSLAGNFYPYSSFPNGDRIPVFLNDGVFCISCLNLYFFFFLRSISTGSSILRGSCIRRIGTIPTFLFLGLLMFGN